MWTRHHNVLARAIAEEAGLPADTPSCAALVHFTLDTAAPGPPPSRSTYLTSAT